MGDGSILMYFQLGKVVYHFLGVFGQLLRFLWAFLVLGLKNGIDNTYQAISTLPYNKYTWKMDQF
jgi:hypothetical protein